MQLFDLHCDTLYKAAMDDSTLYNDAYHINIQKSQKIDTYIQMMAVWIPDGVRNESAVSLFKKCVEIYNRDRLFEDKHKFFLTVEGGSVLAGDLENIKLLTNNCVRALTLTWNNENELAFGAYSKGGLKPFGKEAVKLLQKNKIVVDISHLNEEGFYDVMEIADRPIIATHSNSKSITNSPRNLTDDQFKCIIKSGGIVGLNFYKGFLNNDENKASIDDFLRHAYHFMCLSDDEHICIGSDFDGADMPDDIQGLQDIEKVYMAFCTNFGRKTADKIFFDNANKFFTDFDNMGII